MLRRARRKDVKGGTRSKLVLFTSDDDKEMIGKTTSFTYVVDDLDRTYTELRDRGASS